MLMLWSGAWNDSVSSLMEKPVPFIFLAKGGPRHFSKAFILDDRYRVLRDDKTSGGNIT
jgi:hypothetical protein